MAGSWEHPWVEIQNAQSVLLSPLQAKESLKFFTFFLLIPSGGFVPFVQFGFFDKKMVDSPYFRALRMLLFAKVIMPGPYVPQFLA